ncbi:FAD-dependent monooxygenase [Pseudonocardia acaciae]|uniref:FAD-dependent monooxygenase n=1 Tax=Pseudonocardia acaciae TaxID=551276 RepID=UPI0004917567|nr:FAD-dependent monooxygenase [Pseudonocardia acaciae]
MPSVVIVGAGIGGLSAAIGLHRAGWRVRVLERAEEFAPVGAGITLWPNALRALRALGVELDADGAGVGGVRTRSGRWLARWRWSELERLAGGPLTAVSRARLHGALLDALFDAVPAGAIRLGTTVTEVPEADLVVAADGIDSALRARLFPELPAPVANGTTTWRGIAPVPRSGVPGWSNSWAGAREFGIVPLGRERVYWFAAMPAPPGETHDDERAFVAEHFGDWHEPIPELIATTETVLHLDIRHLATLPASYVAGRVALLGDAAHAMPPNLGQGGGMAIEDALTLAAALADTGDDVPAALARYDRERRPRTAAVAGEAARLSRLMSIGHPAVTAVRDTATRLLPASLMLRSIARWSRWPAPSLPG